MAEVLAIGGSVIAVVQILDQIIRVCKSYIETVQDFPNDLRTILIETTTLKTTFENLGFLASCDKALSNAASTLTGEDGPIEGCRQAIIELEKLFPSDTADAQTVAQPSKRRKLKASLTALAWPLKENRAKKLLDNIARYRANINLVLTAESMSVFSFSYSLE